MPDFNRLKAILNFHDKAPEEKVTNFDSLVRSSIKHMKTPIPLKNDDTFGDGEPGTALRKMTLLTAKNVKSLLIPNMGSSEGAQGVQQFAGLI